MHDDMFYVILLDGFKWPRTTRFYVILLHNFKWPRKTHRYVLGTRRRF